MRRPTRARAIRISTIFGVASLALALVTASIALACNVPVFRYALERWRPDAYRATVVHRGPLDDATKKLLAEIDDQVEHGALNVAVRVVDLAKPVDGDEGGAEAESLSKLLGESQTPKLLVQYPAYLRIATPILASDFDRDAVQRVVTSPIRAELVKRLTEGQTAVWLLLESGDKEKDDTAAKLVAERLVELEKELKLPELTSDSADRLLSKVPLHVSFSVLRLPRTADERMLVELLVRSEDDLADRKDPMIFPVFGRGRALLPLVGAGITPDNVRDSAGFLVGACSCEVKELNPGFDLLLTAAWDDLLEQDGVPAPALPAALTNSDPNAPPELVPIPSGSKQSAAATDASTAASSGDADATSGPEVASAAAPPTASVPVALPPTPQAQFAFSGFMWLGIIVVVVIAAAVVAAQMLRREPE